MTTKTVKGKILYAEDDLNFSRIYSEFIEYFFPDYGLEKYFNGLSLKDRLEKSVEDVKLVLTDNQMPNITGSEIIKNYANKLKVPFILMYGGGKDIGELAIKNGAFGYILKPLSHEKFVEELKKVLKD